MKLFEGQEMLLFKLRLRQVCEKYKTKSVQLEAMRLEVKELKAAGAIFGPDEAFETLIQEIWGEFGTSFKLS